MRGLEIGSITSLQCESRDVVIRSALLGLSICTHRKNKVDISSYQHTNNICETAHFPTRSDSEARNSHNTYTTTLSALIVVRLYVQWQCWQLHIDTQDDNTQLIVDLIHGRHDHWRQDNRGEGETGETQLHAVTTAASLMRLYGIYPL